MTRFSDEESDMEATMAKVEADRERHATKLREIHERWRRVPPMRVATSLDDACNDWPIADFGDSDGESPGNTWLCTNKVHASEMSLSAHEFAAPLAASRDDIRELFKIIAEIGGLTT